MNLFPWTLPFLFVGTLTCALASSDCERGFRRIVSSGAITTLTEATSQFAHDKLVMGKKVASLSFAELRQEVAKAMETLKAQRGHMPGCDPEWSPANVDELIQDFRSAHPDDSMLHQITGNLSSIEMYPEFLAHRIGPLSQSEMTMVQQWQQDSWHLQLFQELEKRLSR